MSPEEIEQEINERVRFKMEEIITGVRSMANLNWRIAFERMSPKHEAKWEAFNELAAMIRKEAGLPVPVANMHQKAAEEQKRKILNPLENYVRTRLRSTMHPRDLDSFISKIVQAVEMAQKFNLE